MATPSNRKETEMELREKYRGALHDNPMTKLRAAQDEARRNSPRSKLLDRQRDEVHELNQKIVRESRAMHLRHTAERGEAAQLSRPELASVDEKRKEQARDMDKRHAEARRVLTAKHDRELAALK
jgi:riboflavin biosynthesis pyrimidine reductase